MHEGAVLQPRNRCCCLLAQPRLQQLPAPSALAGLLIKGMPALAQVRCLNEAVEGSCRKVFKPWHQRLDAAASSSGAGGGQLGATRWHPAA